jgi:hypothetical protein
MIWPPRPDFFGGKIIEQPHELIVKPPTPGRIMRAGQFRRRRRGGTVKP